MLSGVARERLRRAEKNCRPTPTDTQTSSRGRPVLAAFSAWNVSNVAANVGFGIAEIGRT